MPSYTASLPDELDLRPGMKLRVVRLYDDAWGTAQVVSSPEAGDVGKQGAFPIVSLDSVIGLTDKGLRLRGLKYGFDGE